ncbi:MAG TPA: zinc ribbon domain-containing protein [Tepidisphaeraceae bacterium]|jgi:hypothetical protein
MTAQADPSPNPTTEADLFCPHCGYSLRGITSARCPECGSAIDWDAVTKSTISWIHRKRIGRWKAYVRTAAVAIRDPKQLAAEVRHPVTLADALAFRRMTTLIAFFPTALLATSLYLWMLASVSNLSFAALSRGETSALRLAAAMDWLMVPALWISLYLMFLALAGVHSYFFHPRTLTITQQNRAIALSYYAGAALALTPVSYVCVGIVVAMYAARLDRKLPLLIVLLVWIIGTATPVVQIFAWWLSCLRMLRGATHCSRLRQWMLGASLPLSWIILAAIIGGMPLVFGYICLVILSLMRP